MHIRKDDIVQVLTGDDKGKRGRVLRILSKTGKVVVEGVNKVYKHLKPSRQSQQGGRLSKEMPIHVSNVALIDPTSNKPTRAGVRFTADGTKERFAKKSGTTLSRVAPANPKFAKK
ncbi:MAG: 50S ribosomal protein L24 [Gemmataceae bacterium]